jgi:hypothetical protein
VAVEKRGFLAFRAAARRVEDVLFLEPAVLSMLAVRPETPAAAVPIP